MRILMAALLLVGCSGPAASQAPRAGPPPASSSAEPSGRWVTLRDPEWLFEIHHPPSWERGPLLVSHGDWRQWQMLALATYPLRPGGARCSHLPVNALEDLGPQDAFLFIQEPEYVEGLPERRGRFRIEFSTSVDYLYEISLFGCLDEGADFRYAFVPFQDDGRNFFAYLALGTHAPTETRRDLLEVLNSLKIVDADEFRTRY